ncbi:FFLEELY motif protein [Lysobacter tyrosinilyticus]
MSRTSDLSKRLGCLLTRHQTLHDPRSEPRNGLRWLPEVRRWQAQRLEASFDRFLSDPHRRPAAHFFLSDVYNDHDFSRRDADLARVLPMMQRLLPATLLATLSDAIELGLLTHAFDLRVAHLLDGLAPRRQRLDSALYAQAYRESGLPRLRRHQIDLIAGVGQGLAHALRMPGVATLLKLSRAPARAAGLEELQGFLERGFAAFSQLGDARTFIGEIELDEREVARRLFAGDPDPFQGRMK